MYQYFKILHYVVFQLDYLKYFIYGNFYQIGHYPEHQDKNRERM